ncbi:hypothetical protein ADL21_32400 [Streptomyces albus subsp. albus]|nr:hypothetical protein ADL21_32400 [Streptomyces albus subsp. albus]
MGVGVGAGPSAGRTRPDSGLVADRRRQDVEEMGRLMVRLLLRRLAPGVGAARDELAPVVTAATLVVQQSG